MNVPSRVLAIAVAALALACHRTTPAAPPPQPDGGAPAPVALRTEPESPPAGSTAPPGAPTPATAPKTGPSYTRVENVIYGRRGGLALTMDAFTPEKPNGAAVLIFVSAEYQSDLDLLARFHPTVTTVFLKRGYVVFAVLHSCPPKYTVPDIVDDAHRAVRFVKHNAKTYGFDPARLGVAGASSGGHLSLMMGCAGKPGDPGAADPVDRGSSQAAAVACFFPPTDFLALEEKAPPKHLAPAFDFRELKADSGLWERVPAERRREIGRAISPITHVAKGAAPTLIIHGDKDTVVPIEQSRAMIGRLRECGVTCELAVKTGRHHFDPLWVVPALPELADWYDQHLLDKK